MTRDEAYERLIEKHGDIYVTGGVISADNMRAFFDDCITQGHAEIMEALEGLDWEKMAEGYFSSTPIQKLVLTAIREKVKP